MCNFFKKDFPLSVEEIVFPLKITSTVDSPTLAVVVYVLSHSCWTSEIRKLVKCQF